MLKIFSVSCLNLDFVVFSLLGRKTREKYGKIRLKASIFSIGVRVSYSFNHLRRTPLLHNKYKVIKVLESCFKWVIGFHLNNCYFFIKWFLIPLYINISFMMDWVIEVQVLFDRCLLTEPFWEPVFKSMLLQAINNFFQRLVWGKVIMKVIFSWGYPV